MSGKPPFPPFTLETARQKARMAENAWNSKDPDKVSLAYTEDSVWRNRSEFIHGREEILAFLKRKWAKELDYKLIKKSGPAQTTASLFAFSTNGTTAKVNGFVPMATRTGNLPRTV